MTKNGLTSEEKAVLLGMGVVMDVDFCRYFSPCPPEGCEQCPLNRLTDLHSEFVGEIARLAETE